MISIVEQEWSDPSRDRAIPARIYVPGGDGPAPVIVFSHATGGARDGYAYLGRAWASHGYVSAHLQHRGSDVDIWRGKAGGAMPAMRRAAADPQNALDRVLDVVFALDRLESALPGRVDMDRVGLGGHSFGAGTALAAVGETFVTPAGEERTIVDPRVKAVIAMSSPRPWTAPDATLRTFSAIRVPCLHFTGTLDDSPVNDTKAVERRGPFDHIHGSDQILVTLNGGDHMVFAGAKRLFNAEKDPVFQDIVARASVRFWDACLKDDSDAAAWLWQGGLEALVGGEGVLEARRAAPVTT